jgi:hypothetical protein
VDTIQEPGGSLVEQHAKNKGLATVRLTRHDLLSVLTGSPMMCSDDRGNEVAVRMFRPEELIEAQRERIDRTRAFMGDDFEPQIMSLDMAKRLTETVPPALVWGPLS